MPHAKLPGWIHCNLSNFLHMLRQVTAIMLLPCTSMLQPVLLSKKETCNMRILWQKLARCVELSKGLRRHAAPYHCHHAGPCCIALRADFRLHLPQLTVLIRLVGLVGGLLWIGPFLYHSVHQGASPVMPHALGVVAASTHYCNNAGGFVLLQHQS